MSEFHPLPSRPSTARPLVAVLAVGRNGAIGRENKLPWIMPTDLARFRAITMGKPMIMGRRTHDTIGKALPGRESIVVSRRAHVEPPSGVHLVTNLNNALAVADRRAAAMGASEIALIGGAKLFEALLPFCARIHLTIVDLRPAADTFFGPLDPYVWQEVARLTPPRHSRDEADCVFIDYAPA